MSCLWRLNRGTGAQYFPAQLALGDIFWWVFLSGTGEGLFHSPADD